MYNGRLCVQDIWSLGVTVFEALVGPQALRTLLAKGGEGVVRRAAGGDVYPWEAASPPHSFMTSRLKLLVLACLSRDANGRPSAESILKQISELGM